MGVSLFLSLFPWLFAYQGEICGHAVSLRSLGKLSGGLLVLTGGWILFRNSLPKFLLDIGVSIETLSDKKFRWAVGIFTFLFIVGAISHKFKAHQMVSTHAFDLGFFSNICWNTANGNWFFSSVLERNFMSVHVNWILWPLSWVYRIWADARVLLIAQAVFMGAAMPILVLLTRRLTGSLVMAALVGMMFVCSPFFLHSLFNDFHPDAWQIPLLMGALWAFHERKPVSLLLLSAAALFAKEDVSVVLSGFALFLLARPSWRGTGVVLLVLAVGVFVFHTSYFIPRYLDGPGESLLFTRYNLGNSFSEIVSNFFTEPTLILGALFHEPIKYWRFLNYFFPMAGLTFLAPSYIIPCLISVMPHLLATASTQLSLADIYAMPSQPFVFVGAVMGLAKLRKTRWFENHTKRWVALSFLVAGMGILNSPRTFRTLSPERLQSFQKVKMLIPADASVVAQQNLLPHFDTRRHIQLFPIATSMTELQHRVLKNPEYAVCDRIGNALPFDEKILATAIVAMEKNTAYEKIFEENDFLIFRRLAAEPLVWQ